MSGKKEKELIEKLGKIGQAPIQVFPATVTAVDEATATVDVVDAYETEFYNVRLKASIDSDTNRVIMVPHQDSTILVGLIGNSENALYMVRASKVQKILADMARTTIEITAEGIVIDGGENGPVLVSQSLIDDLNEVKQDLNDLKTVFSGWTTSGGDGGAALKTAAATWYTQQLSDTALEDVTNEKFKH